MNTITLDVLKSYAEILQYFYNSNLIPRDCEIYEDINEMLLIPILRLQELIQQKKDISEINKKTWEEISVFANSIWYSKDQRSDIRNTVLESTIKIPAKISDVIFKYFDKPLNSKIDFNLIADLSGLIENECKKI